MGCFFFLHSSFFLPPLPPLFPKKEKRSEKSKKRVKRIINNTSYENTLGIYISVTTGAPTINIPSNAKAAWRTAIGITDISLRPNYTYGTTDLTPGVSNLATGQLYFVYE